MSNDQQMAARLGRFPDWTEAETQYLIRELATGMSRDIDIVRLQKRLIAGVAEKEEDERQAALADEKVMEFKSANVRPVPVEKPNAWGE